MAVDTRSTGTESLTNEQLALKAQQGDTEAYEQLFIQVERFLRKKAYDYSTTSFTYDADDIFGFGCEAFVKAVSDFDPSKGKFITVLGFYFFNYYHSRYSRRERAHRKYESLKGLDDTAHIGDNGKTVTFLDLVGGENWDDTGLHISAIVKEFNNILSTFSDRDQMIVIKVILDKRLQREVAQEVGLEQASVSRIVVKFRKQLETHFKNLDLI